MFKPVEAAHNIEKRFAQYITTTLGLADPDYAKQFEEQLHKDIISKGPYVDMTDIFETGASIDTLMEEGVISKLFRDIEKSKPKYEKRSLPLDRSLYKHQENAIRKASERRNLVVTTGTGSGKTECFLIPVINQLLFEKEAGTLSPGVRTMIIYPMNALANDQIKRLRELLNKYPYIKFGCFTGETQEEEAEALRQYESIYKDQPKLPNEIISREQMRKTPPHILVTNYAMLEYLMLRPGDNIFFDGEYADKWRFVILDEAHVYGGATGMEVSMLLRRLKARLACSDNIQYILTSATLGDGEKSDDEIVDFASQLCHSSFKKVDIVRSVRKKREGPAAETRFYPVKLYEELCDTGLQDYGLIYDTLKGYGYSHTGERDIGVILYDFFMQDGNYHVLRDTLTGPMTINELADCLKSGSEEVAFLIAAAGKALKNKSSLFQARYHFFIRALEGAYVTLPPHKKLFLQRMENVIDGKDTWKSFEIATCSYCNALYLVGYTNDGILTSSPPRDSYKNELEYYLLSGNKHYDVDADALEEGIDIDYEKQEYYLCSKCGAIERVTSSSGSPCSCGRSNYVRVLKVENEAGNVTRCLSCSTSGASVVHRFMLGLEAATSVLATNLYEEIPARARKKTKIQAKTDDVFGFGSNTETIEVEVVDKTKQFIAFSDSRQDAAFFACYFEITYNDLLRRRALIEVLSKNRDSILVNRWTPITLVNALQVVFQENNIFSDAFERRREAWKTILNEMINSQSRHSLSSLGLMTFDWDSGIKTLEKMGLNEQETKALLNVLVDSFRLDGALQYEEGALQVEDKRYLMFASDESYFIPVKESGTSKGRIIGWKAKQRKGSNSYHPNKRTDYLLRSMGFPPETANNFLQLMWDTTLKNKCLAGTSSGHRMLVDAFRIKCGDDPGLTWYYCSRCGRITTNNLRNACPTYRCEGKLEKCDPKELFSENHYVRLYSEMSLHPLVVKEHTAQLSKETAYRYQNDFINKGINVLSCSTTFEMGVDVGDLETVFMRNMPPSPSNYAQRAGRAGRRTDSAAFALTYCKLSSHDYYFFNNPKNMITGKIAPPKFTLENKKIIIRHVYASAFGMFFSRNSEYCKNVQTFIEKGGLTAFTGYLDSKPESLKKYLEKCVPSEVQKELEIATFGWLGELISEDKGLLQVVSRSYLEDIETLSKEWDKLLKSAGAKGSVPTAAIGQIERTIKTLREERIINFLARRNILPKYGFPVDNVELFPNINKSEASAVNLCRDLSMAISEYAPESQVVADGKLWTSRYIKRVQTKAGSKEWEKYDFACCPNESCGAKSVRIHTYGEKAPGTCNLCGNLIDAGQYETFIMPRFGFIADPKIEKATTQKPEKTYRSDIFYIGDAEEDKTESYKLEVNGHPIEIRSTSNDSLMVVNNSDFFVCNECGYSILDEIHIGNTVAREHQDPFGKKCSNRTLEKNKLGHMFKTDVAQLLLMDLIVDRDKAWSILYALLEGMSRELEIERDDISGCLHSFRTEKGKWNVSFIVFDSVPGGAGHVRRLGSDDATILERVFKGAFKVANDCTCGGDAADTSCYMCLRTYRNQKQHDILKRKHVIDFYQQFFA